MALIFGSIAACGGIGTGLSLLIKLRRDQDSTTQAVADVRKDVSEVKVDTKANTKEIADLRVTIANQSTAIANQHGDIKAMLGKITTKLGMDGQ